MKKNIVRKVVETDGAIWNIGEYVEFSDGHISSIEVGLSYGTPIVTIYVDDELYMDIPMTSVRRIFYTQEIVPDEF